ncbi:hypothetical protein Anapl_14017 [Anas platyrhynchos]|uniref:Uncharacterized protein n=1 Tax=Anas platyrhynchos TaxID=8839 RepID=R0LCU5_ANAPL|nr:hypothetical protein Anapl_14017 [Anas platyrhynchos]
MGSPPPAAGILSLGSERSGQRGVGCLPAKAGTKTPKMRWTVPERSSCSSSSPGRSDLRLLSVSFGHPTALAEHFGDTATHPWERSSPGCCCGAELRGFHASELAGARSPHPRHIKSPRAARAKLPLLHYSAVSIRHPQRRQALLPQEHGPEVKEDGEAGPCSSPVPPGNAGSRAGQCWGFPHTIELFFIVQGKKELAVVALPWWLREDLPLVYGEHHQRGKSSSQPGGHQADLQAQRGQCHVPVAGNNQSPRGQEVRSQLAWMRLADPAVPGERAEPGNFPVKGGQNCEEKEQGVPNNPFPGCTSPCLLPGELLVPWCHNSSSQTPQPPDAQPSFPSHSLGDGHLRQVPLSIPSNKTTRTSAGFSSVLTQPIKEHSRIPAGQAMLCTHGSTAQPTNMQHTTTNTPTQPVSPQGGHFPCPLESLEQRGSRRMGVVFSISQSFCPGFPMPPGPRLDGLSVAEGNKTGNPRAWIPRWQCHLACPVLAVKVLGTFLAPIPCT